MFRNVKCDVLKELWLEIHKVSRFNLAVQISFLAAYQADQIIHFLFYQYIGNQKFYLAAYIL